MMTTIVLLLLLWLLLLLFPFEATFHNGSQFLECLSEMIHVLDICNKSLLQIRLSVEL